MVRKFKKRIIEYFDDDEFGRFIKKFKPGFLDELRELSNKERQERFLEEFGRQFKFDTIRGQNFSRGLADSESFMRKLYKFVFPGGTFNHANYKSWKATLPEPVRSLARRLRDAATMEESREKLRDTAQVKIRQLSDARREFAEKVSSLPEVRIMEKETSNAVREALTKVDEELKTKKELLTGLKANIKELQRSRKALEKFVTT